MSNKQNDIIFEQEAEFAEQEHKAGFHTLYQPKCSTCWSENLVIHSPRPTSNPWVRGSDYEGRPRLPGDEE